MLHNDISNIVKIKKNSSGNYSVSFITANGKTATRSLGTKNLETARKLCKDAKIKELELAARAGALQKDAIAAIVANQKIKLTDLVKEWKGYKTALAQSVNTIFTQETLINAFINQSTAKYLHTVTKEMVSAYINSPGSAKAGSRDQRHSALKSMYQFAIASGYTITNPTQLVAIDKSKLSHEQKEKKPRVPLTTEEYNTVIAHSDYFFCEATALAWWTGMRMSDIARLEWDSIDFKKKTLTVHTKKRDARICLPLGHELIGGGCLLKLLGRLKEDARSKKYVFPKQRELDLNPSRRSTLSVYYTRMLNRLNIEGKSFHCLRHSFVSRCARKGKTLEDIAIWVGHSSSSTTETYHH